MIAWAIGCAIDSQAFDDVIVSTDDREIADVALSLGAKVPFMRPAHLSDDYSGLMPVMQHALNWWNENVQIVDHACCIYATNPFLAPKLLVESMNLLRSSDTDFVLSVRRFDYPVQRSLRFDTNSFLKFVSPESALIRSQDLESRYHDAGQFFAGRAECFNHYKTAMDACCLPIIVPNYESVDIDTEEDWQFAERLFTVKFLENGYP